ncbi:MAG: DUF1150 family protein [Alphaproteobacteria bacterium]|nr:DUF1150 family protein [Alphaproteobacteria bacterium]
MTTEKISTEQLALIGNGVLAYVREIEGRSAKALLGGQLDVAPDAKLFCLYNANGQPISISQSHEAALGSAFEHELIAATLQ